MVGGGAGRFLRGGFFLGSHVGSNLRQQGLALCGGAVALQAAGGFVRQGHGKQALVQQGNDVALVVQVGIAQAQHIQQFLFAARLCGAMPQQLENLRTDLLIDLCMGVRK